MQLPWWTLSPSPFTVAMYAGLALYGYRKAEGSTVNRYIDALLVLGTVVLFGDLQWVLLQAVKFYKLHPEGVMQLVFCFFRDLAGLVFCYSLIREYFHDKVKWYWAGWLVNLVFIAAWFHTAKTPALTDWTYALRYGYGWQQAWTAFTLSHIIGRVITGWIYVKMWN